MAVSAKNFRFVSPGVRIEEIDRSQIPADEPLVGACIIGRARRGPAFTPVEIRSFSDFVQTFGEPVAGGQAGDVWRDGNYTSPMYGTYAAQSWLKNGESLNYVRVLGVQSDNAVTDSGEAGWKIGSADFVNNYNEGTNTGGAYALAVWASGNIDEATGLTGSIAAVWYLEEGTMFLSGTSVGHRDVDQVLSVPSTLLKTDGAKFKVSFETGSNLPSGTFEFDFTKGSSNYIRKVFNTDPTLIGRNGGTNGEVRYFLGESYENSIPTATNYFAAIIGLGTGSVGASANTQYENVVFHDVRRGALTSSTYSKSGWFLSQDLSSDTASWDSSSPANNITNGRIKKLFRFVGLDAGEWTQQNLKVSVVNIRGPVNEDVDPYGTFTVILRQLKDSDDDKKVLETFSGCNLNPNSDNYILNKIGDKYTTFDEVTNRIIEKGEYPNRSKYVRVEVNTEFSEGFPADYAPFGITGPTKFVKTRFSNVNGSGSVGTETDGICGGLGLRVMSTDATNGFGGGYILSGAQVSTAGFDLEFPSANTRSNTSNLEDFRIATFGALPTPDKSNNFKADTLDLVRPKPANVASQYDAVTNVLDYQFITFLDNLVISGSELNASTANLAAQGSIKRWRRQLDHIVLWCN